MVYSLVLVALLVFSIPRIIVRLRPEYQHGEDSRSPSKTNRTIKDREDYQKRPSLVFHSIFQEKHRMFVRITIMVMRLLVLIVLILGILFWTNVAGGALVVLHMGLGILIACLLVILGGFIAIVKERNIVLALTALGVAICMVALGLRQQSILPDSPLHWIIQVVHLLLGLSALGTAEMIARHYKRLRVAKA
jgi:hypothetical protein